MVLSRLHLAVDHSVDVDVLRGVDVDVYIMLFQVWLMLAEGRASRIASPVFDDGRIIGSGVTTVVFCLCDGLRLDIRKVDEIAVQTSDLIRIEVRVLAEVRRTVEIHFRNNGVLLAGVLHQNVRPAVDGVVLAELPLGRIVLIPLVMRMADLIQLDVLCCEVVQQVAASASHTGEKLRLGGLVIVSDRFDDDLLIVIDHADDIRPAVDRDRLKTCGRVFGVRLVVVPLAVVVPAVEVVFAAVVRFVVVGDLDRAQINDCTLRLLFERNRLEGLGHVAVAVDHQIDRVAVALPTGIERDVARYLGGIEVKRFGAVRIRVPTGERVTRAGRGLSRLCNLFALYIEVVILECADRILGGGHVFYGVARCVGVELDRVEPQIAVQIGLILFLGTNMDIRPVCSAEHAACQKLILVDARSGHQIEKHVFYDVRNKCAVFIAKVIIAIRSSDRVRAEVAEQDAAVVAIRLQTDASKRLRVELNAGVQKAVFAVGGDRGDVGVHVGEAPNRDLRVVSGLRLCLPAGSRAIDTFHREGPRQCFLRGQLVRKLAVHADLCDVVREGVCLERCIIALRLLVIFDGDDLIVIRLCVGAVVYERNGQAVLRIFAACDTGGVNACIGCDYADLLPLLRRVGDKHDVVYASFARICVPFAVFIVKIPRQSVAAVKVVRDTLVALAAVARIGVGVDFRVELQRVVLLVRLVLRQRALERERSAILDFVAVWLACRRVQAEHLHIARANDLLRLGDHLDLFPDSVEDIVRIARGAHPFICSQFFHGEGWVIGVAVGRPAEELVALAGGNSPSELERHNIGTLRNGLLLRRGQVRHRLARRRICVVGQRTFLLRRADDIDNRSGILRPFSCCFIVVERECYRLRHTGCARMYGVRKGCTVVIREICINHSHHIKGIAAIFQCCFAINRICTISQRGHKICSLPLLLVRRFIIHAPELEAVLSDDVGILVRHFGNFRCGASNLNCRDCRACTGD